eukprot:TRINITY_DN4509_c0_g1_i3.p1 TRINITY_DN4509_c0_g1~~TRINITY_DN4509_c0_g1_i3.p1  ORF type:complete len:751 (+),score=179.87 TRINITY_DN4509_c0_g1_i3:64-2316(+)
MADGNQDNPKNPQSLQVKVRVRPLSRKESQANLKSIARVVEEKLVVILDPTEGEDYLRINRSRERQFAFDQVFDENASQLRIFAQSAEPLVPYVLEGYNATVFAYGSTGAGKTYTMLGTEVSPGIMFLTLHRLFEEIEGRSDAVASKVTISYLEVYNEYIRDLLKPQSGHLDLREDPIKGISVSNITEYTTTSAQEVLHLLHQGNRRRTTEATGANEVSSRSHAVMQIVIEQKERIANVSAEVIISKLSMIDLAGSERATVTQNSGKRMMEGANINRSLLALANCINALGDKSKIGSYVPYRDSKLTRLLKDSLGGDCRTVMIANISPASNQFEETVNTLKYANRAKNIKVSATKKIKNVSYHVSEYQKIISELRNEIFELKKQLVVSVPKHPSGESHEGDLSRSQLLRQRRNSLEEKKTLDRFQGDLMEIFEDRIQLRRSLMELQDTIIQNKIEITNLEERLTSGSDIRESPDYTHNIHAEIDTIRYNLMKNEELKGQFLKNLHENDHARMEIMEALPAVITRQDRMQVIELLVKAQELEMNNMELELQLEIRNKIILDQRKLLQENGLDHLVRYESQGLGVKVASGKNVERMSRPPSAASERITPKPSSRPVSPTVGSISVDSGRRTAQSLSRPSSKSRIQRLESNFDRMRVGTPSNPQAQPYSLGPTSSLPTQDDRTTSMPYEPSPGTAREGIRSRDRRRRKEQTARVTSARDTSSLHADGNATQDSLTLSADPRRPESAVNIDRFA